MTKVVLMLGATALSTYTLSGHLSKLSDVTQGPTGSSAPGARHLRAVGADGTPVLLEDTPTSTPRVVTHPLNESGTGTDPLSESTESTPAGGATSGAAIPADSTTPTGAVGSPPTEGLALSASAPNAGTPATAATQHRMPVPRAKPPMPDAGGGDKGTGLGRFLKRTFTRTKR